MGGQEDFAKALKAIMAAKREELGEPPTPEELLAYRDGRLDPGGRERMEARIAVHPDAARALADLAAFPAVEPAPGTPELTDEDLDVRWQAFRQRVAALPPAPHPPAPLSHRTPTDRERGGKTEGRRRRLFAPRLAAAAVLALAAGWAGGFLTGRASHDRPGSAVNIDIVELTPEKEGGDRSPAAAVEMPAEELVLILGAPEEGGFANYEARIVDAQGSPVWSRTGLHPTPLGTFHLSFQRGALQPGTYGILLFGQEGKRRKPVATYELRLQEGPASR